VLPVVYDCKAYCCVSGVSFHTESSLFYKCVTYVVLCIIVYNSYHWHISVMQKVHHLGSLCCVSSLCLRSFVFSRIFYYTLIPVQCSVSWQVFYFSMQCKGLSQQVLGVERKCTVMRHDSTLSIFTCFVGFSFIIDFCLLKKKLSQS